MTTPKYLTPGSRVGILATGRRIKPDDIATALDVLRDWGLKVVLSPYLFSTDHSYLAGSDDQRTAALQQFLDDQDLQAIFCARGGYGTTRIIDKLDFTEFQKSPKWIVGFSDVTALHLRLSAIGSKSIHGTMPALFSKPGCESSLETLHSALFGHPREVHAKGSPINKHGSATGVLLGGNLSLLVDALGTSDEPVTDGKILVVEEVDEYLYKIDRMFVQLKRAGKLAGLSGLAVGYFSDVRDTELSFGESFEHIIRTHTKEYNFPVGFNFPIGHLEPNDAWISGATALLSVGAEESFIRYQDHVSY